ncbi:hypothetical protein HBI25_198150 [Parastagonospora nodorum]|nr:hypothetical protein HBI01_181390 [Parastagonospora nodorum]KAH4293146.1 hypothetical protein HBI02_185900 [Parastagonospora nodorum]KAH4323951.1 hypothetical protein HBI00_174380 [Parastagonospora nodorum]KAH4361123.1 hypothetical protein HBH94_186340 [Parastagonospora nodorum]KAH4456905.1 hypothetical protein HBH90_165630 [Parastagonospora nodorum]
MSTTKVSGDETSSLIHMMLASEQDFPILTRELAAPKPRLSQIVHDIVELIEKSRHFIFGKESDLAAFTKCNAEALGHDYLLFELSNEVERLLGKGEMAQWFTSQIQPARSLLESRFFNNILARWCDRREEKLAPGPWADPWADLPRPEGFSDHEEYR